MSSSKSDLEESLRQVQQGLAQLRLPQDTTSLSDLLTNLGPPPPEIQADWDRQLSTLIQQFEQSAGRPIGELYASDFLVDADNRLSFSPSFWTSLESTPAPSPSSSIQAFPQITRVDDKQPHEKQASDSSTSANRSPADRKAMSRLRAFAKKHRWATPLAVLTSAAIMMGLAFYGFATNDSEGQFAQRTTSPANDSTDSIFSPGATPSRKQTAAPESPSSQAEPTELSYLDSPEDATESATTSSVTSATQPAPDRSTMGLDSFGTADWVSASDLSGMNEGELAPPDEIEPNDAPESPPATDSITVAAKDTNTLELPALPTSSPSDEEPASVVIIAQPPTATELLFPTEVGLSLRGPKQEVGVTVWEVIDDKDDVALAKLTSFSGKTDEQATTDSLDVGLSFHWSSVAATRPKAKQLSSGLLKVSFPDGQTQSLFLRPRLSAQPWPVDFSEPDVKVAWPIMHAPPAGPAELQFEFDVPKTVTQAWVQAHDVKQWRRSQSLVEFKLQSDPSIAIRSRIDLRTGNRIQLRMRHAAQLDPSFPWMSVSTSRIENASNDLAQRLTLANAQLAELKSAYARAGQTGKRLVANRRDAIETVITNLEALNKRLIKYDQLISTVDKTAALSVQLSVPWPESTGAATQVIFHMPTSERPEAE